MNSSEEEIQGFHSSGYRKENILFSTFYIFVFIIAVPSNALALWTFFHQEKRSSSRIFLSQLSIADICYVLILPMRIVYHLSDSHWPFGLVLCRVGGFLFHLNLYCSIYFISFISLDRLLAVVLPVKSKLLRKAAYAKIIAAFIWVITTLSLSPKMFSNIKANNTSAGTCNLLYLEESSPPALVSTVVAFLIPFITILVSYALILQRLRLIKQHIKRKMKEKAIKMIVLVVVNFMCAFVPYHVNRVIYIASHSYENITVARGESLKTANRITAALTCISAVLDPVLYFFLNHAYKDILLRLCCGNRSNYQ